MAAGSGAAAGGRALMFSVVVPLWNKRRTLRRTIEHALAQSFRAFELIVIDDGSTDGSLDTLAGLADPRLRVIRQANAGEGRARNRGVSEARHEWVAFLDADDLWLPGHLAELNRIRARFPSAGLIGTRYITSDARGRFRLPRAAPGAIERVCLFDSIGRAEPVLHVSSAAAPAALLREIGGFAPHPRGADSELWARIALDYPVACSSRATAVYMRGTGGVTDTVPKAWGSGAPRTLDDLSPAVALVLERLPGVSEPSRREAIERYVERYLDWTMRTAVAMRDLATLRALGRLRRRRPPMLPLLVDRVAPLPAPLAWAAARVMLAVDAAGRRLKRQMAPSSAPGRNRAMPRPSRSGA